MARDDDKKRQKGAFGTGQAVGRALTTVKQGIDRAEEVGQGVAAAAADQVTYPTRRLANAAANLGRGIGAATGITPNARPVAFNPSPMQDRVAAQRPEVYGLPRRALPAAPTPAAPAAPTPGAASTIPAGAPAQPVAHARGADGMPDRGGGSSRAAAGAPAPVAAPPPQPGDVNTFHSTRTGVTQRVQPATAAAAPVAGAASNTVAPTRTLSQAEPRAPQFGAAVGRRLSGDLRGAEQERQGLQREIESLAFRNSIGGLRSRGKRQFAGELLGLQRQLTGQRVDQATQLQTAGAAGDNAAALQAQELSGRALEGRGDRQLARQLSDQREAGANSRAAQEIQAGRRVLTTEDGSYGLLGENGELTPIVGADGEQARAQRPQADPLRDRDILDAYNQRYEAIVQNTFGDPAAAAAQIEELNAEPLGQRYQQMLGGKPVPAGMTRVGTTPDGRPVYRDADGNTFTDE